MENKVALITGAAGGVGREIAGLLDKEGYLLVLVDINEKGLQDLASGLNADSQYFSADITSLEEIRRIRAWVLETYGKLDVLINNAGIVSTEPFEERELEDIEREMNINYTAPARLIREFVPRMKERRSGHIISVCSLAGILPLKESPVYAASKFALRGLMLSLNLSLKPFGIGVSNVCPTAIDTPLLHREVLEGGSSLNFLAEPLPASVVAEAVLAAIHDKKMEICVPCSEGIGSKLLAFFPSLIPVITPILEKMAKKRCLEYIERKGSIENDE